MRRKLVIAPRGGLCNRLSALASGLRLARKYDRELILDWPRDTKCGASFSQLFTNPFPMVGPEDLPGAKDFDITHNYTPYEKRGVPASTDAEVVRVTSYTLFYDIQEWVAMRDGAGVDDPNRKIAVTYRQLGPYLKELQPVAAVQRTVQDFCQKVKRPWVGVHVRRGDHTTARKNSTDEKFLARLRTILKNEPSSVFFLATDEPQVERTFRKNFGDAVFVMEKSAYQRAVAESILQAMMDLYGLARSTSILGSYGSSFSLVASLLGNVKLEWVT